MKTTSATISDQKIAAAKIELLIKQNKVTFFASNLGAPTVLATLLYLIGKSSPAIIVTWLLVGYTICLVRFLHHQKLQDFENIKRSITGWESDLIILSAFSGCFWSASGILFMDTTNTAQSLTVIAGLIGVISGSAPALISHRKIFLTFILSAWIPTGLYFLFQAEPLYIGIAVMGTVFVAIVISFSISQFRAIEYSLRVKYENIELLEELKIQKQNAEDANKAKSRFLAVASHDLRQPIHAMRLFSETLSQRIDDKQNLSIMAKLKTSIVALSDLLDSLLDLSKLDAEAIIPNKHDINVSSLLRSIATEASAQCHAKGLKWTCRCPESFYLNTDAVLLERILRNLIWNAIKCTSTGGILIAARKRNHCLRIEVWDTGHGIPPNEFKSIFKEFHQIEIPELETQNGIGLGLSIVDRLCQLLGFTISLRSTPGRGSVFFLEMPLLELSPDLAVPATEPRTQASLPDSDLTGVQILVVEDDKNILLATKQILKKWGCHPLTATTDKEVQLLLETVTPDLILTDYTLRNSVPGDKIIELVEAQVGFKIPSIILTGDTVIGDIKQAKLLADVFLYKPVEPETLRKVIIQLLNQQLVD